MPDIPNPENKSLIYPINGKNEAYTVPVLNNSKNSKIYLINLEKREQFRDV